MALWNLPNMQDLNLLDLVEVVQPQTSVDVVLQIALIQHLKIPNKEVSEVQPTNNYGLHQFESKNSHYVSSYVPQDD